VLAKGKFHEGVGVTVTAEIVTVSLTKSGRGTSTTHSARPLYFSGIDKIIQELKLDMAAQTANLRERWDVAEVEIITSGRRCRLDAELGTGRDPLSGAGLYRRLSTRRPALTLSD
jgi:hypothetical protein